MDQRKIAVITGANSGIGQAAALRFATEGVRVVMACRDKQRSEAVRQELAARSGNPGIDLIPLDVSSFESIHTFCKAFTETYPRLDILVHNAAYLNHGEKTYRLSPEGVELSYATNAFGPTYMSHLLADSLAKSDDPRVLNACTTNIKNFFDPKRKIEFDNLRGEFKDRRPYSSYKMYGDSKMALFMLTIRLAEEWKERGIKVNALQINRVRLSDATIRKMNGIWRILARAQNWINPPPEGMAGNYYRICTSDEFRRDTGQLINHRLERMRPAASEQGLEQIRNIFGSATYPKYATESVNANQVWQMYQDLREGKSFRKIP